MCGGDRHHLPSPRKGPASFAPAANLAILYARKAACRPRLPRSPMPSPARCAADAGGPRMSDTLSPNVVDRILIMRRCFTLVCSHSFHIGRHARNADRAARQHATHPSTWSPGVWGVRDSGALAGGGLGRGAFPASAASKKRGAEPSGRRKGGRRGGRGRGWWGRW